MFLLFWSVVYFTAIFQDFISAKLATTGFYWSDTLLYNTYWLWFIPILFVLRKSTRVLRLEKVFNRIAVYGLMGVLFSIIHVFLFTSTFILISNVIFTPSHRFLSIFESVVSNQLYITLIAYTFIPILFKYTTTNQYTRKTDVQKRIAVRRGKKRIRINIETIQAITANRPYSEIRVNEQRYLHNASLKEMEQILSSDYFIRVHRSTIVNSGHILELKTRKNGDYDAMLTNGQTIRLSRHYRKNWNTLLIH